MRRRSRFGVALLAGVVALAWGAAAPAAEAPRLALTGYGAQAAVLRAYTAARLGYYGAAGGCPSAPFVSYVRSDVDPTVVDAWYVGLQVSADAALVALGAEEYRCPMDKGLVYLERLWDPAGGYAPRADPDGLAPSAAEKFADDNALIGLSYLDAAAVTGDPVTQAYYVSRAAAAADYLLGEHWDETFGGGGWWSTRRAAAREGKPAQANALAAALFLRLAQVTGEAVWDARAAETLAWLDTALWDGDQGLYRWAVHYADPVAQVGQTVSPYYFNYDQALAIDALLLRHARGAGHAADLARAQRIAGALEEAFWDARRPGFSLRSGVVWIYPVFAAWLTPALVALHAADGDARWLALARRNVEALAASMRDADDGAYLDYAWDCTRWLRNRDRCPESGWVLGTAKHTGAQASMQRALAALAAAGEQPTPATSVP